MKLLPSDEVFLKLGDEMLLGCDEEGMDEMEYIASNIYDLTIFVRVSASKKKHKKFGISGKSIFFLTGNTFDVA